MITLFSRRVMLAVPLIAMLGMVCATGAEPVLLPKSPDERLRLGDTLHLMSNVPRAWVMDKPKLVDIERGLPNAPSGLLYDLVVIHTIEELIELAKMCGQWDAKYGRFSTGGSFATMAERGLRKEVLFFALRGIVRFQPTSFTPRLTAEVRADLEAFLKKHGPEAFVEAYGHGVVDSTVNGGGMVALYQFEFKSEEKKRAAQVTLKAEMTGFGKADAAVYKSVKQFYSEAKLHVEAFQVGGKIDPSVVNLITAKPGELAEIAAKLEAALKALNSDNCPAIYYTMKPWGTVCPSLAFDPKLKAELDLQAELMVERRRVLEWVIQARTFAANLERIRQFSQTRGEKLGDGGRSADIQLAQEKALNWLEKPIGTAPKLPKLKLTEKDIKGLIELQWVYGQHLEMQDNQRVVTNFSAALSVNLRLPNLIDSLEIVNKNTSARIVITKEEFTKFTPLAELIEGQGNNAQDAQGPWCTKERFSRSHYDRNNTVGGTPGSIRLTRPCDKCPSAGAHLQTSRSEFYKMIEKVDYEIHVKSTSGDIYVFDAGDATKAPGVEP
jgi:hypothetical protein